MINYNQNHNLSLDDFKSSNTGWMAQYLYNMYFVITSLNLWHKFIDDIPNKNEGYAYTELDWVHQIGDHPLIENDCHTGTTFAICMRNMEYIAKNGEQKYLTEIKN